MQIVYSITVYLYHHVHIGIMIDFFRIIGLWIIHYCKSSPL